MKFASPTVVVQSKILNCFVCFCPLSTPLLSFSNIEHTRNTSTNHCSTPNPIATFSSNHLGIGKNIRHPSKTYEYTSGIAAFSYHFFLSKPILGRVMAILPIILKHGYNIQTVSILLELVSCLSPYVWKTIGNLKKTQDKTFRT